MSRSPISAPVPDLPVAVEHLSHEPPGPRCVAIGTAIIGPEDPERLGDAAVESAEHLRTIRRDCRSWVERRGHPFGAVRLRADRAVDPAQHLHRREPLCCAPGSMNLDGVVGDLPPVIHPIDLDLRLAARRSRHPDPPLRDGALHVVRCRSRVADHRQAVDDLLQVIGFVPAPAEFERVRPLSSPLGLLAWCSHVCLLSDRVSAIPERRAAVAGKYLPLSPARAARRRQRDDHHQYRPRSISPKSSGAPRPVWREPR